MRDFHTPGRSAVFAANGLCATSHPLAAKVGVDTLLAGGNAVDASIAMAAMLGLCEPAMTGLFGDCFALVKEPGKPAKGLNASGKAPAGLDTQALIDANVAKIPADDPAAITLPGAVDGFCKLHEDFGSLSLSQILAPAIKYADEGIPVAPRVAFDWQEWSGNLRGNARDLYLNNGKALRSGDLFRAPGQAEILRRVASEGRAGFYSGEVAEDFIKSLQALGGSHGQEDFDTVRADYVEPVETTYKGHRLIELPPNSQGPMALVLTNMLAQFDVAAMDPLGVERIHLEAELTKLAFDARDRFVGDPAHSAGFERILRMETAEELSALFDPKKVMDQARLATESVHKETVYLCAIDRDGMLVSLIYSIFNDFGSGCASDKFGVLFHNRGCGFNLIPGHPNQAAPRRRPLHTIIPAMLEEPDGALTAFGVMGAAYQAIGHARYLTNIVDFGMNPQAAIDAPRSFAVDGELRVERGYAASVRADLVAMGHQVTIPDTPIGGAQAARLDAKRGVIEGGSDPRKDGIALGY